MERQTLLLTKPNQPLSDKVNTSELICLYLINYQHTLSLPPAQKFSKTNSNFPPINPSQLTSIIIYDRSKVTFSSIAKSEFQNKTRAWSFKQ